MNVNELFNGLWFLEGSSQRDESPAEIDFGPRYGNRVAARRFFGDTEDAVDAKALDDGCAAGCG